MAESHDRALRRLGLHGMPRMHANRRRLLQGGAGLGLAAGLGRFGATPARAQDDTVLTFFHDKTPWQGFFEQLGDMAQEEIGVNWEVSGFPDTTSYQAAILPALPSNDPPDFFTWWSGYRIEDLYTAGVLEDLSDIWSEAIAAGNLPESLNGGFTFDGAQYAIPGNVSYWGVFYNMRLFDEHGLSVPTTWDEFLGAAETFKAAGVTPFAATQDGRWPSFIWFEEMVLRTDPAFYQALTAGEASYTDPTAVQAMETWQSLIEAEYFTSFDTTMDNDWPSLFAQGELAMIPIGSWYQSTLLASELVPGEDFDIFIMPNINPDVTDNVCIVETGAIAVALNSQRKEAAREMAAWWVSPEAQTAWTNFLGDAPANPTATSDNPVLNGLLANLTENDYTLYQRYWEASPVPIVEGAVDFLAQFMLNPGDLMSVLEQIQTLAETEWAAREA
ncbi:MAG: extracellular solute-binding protein [Chloroflexota bacterium]|nr:extracellular solute-binding protein [Chloroflexota bacterium]